MRTVASRCDLSLSEEQQQTAKYIHTLKYHVALQDLYSVDEAHNKVIKVERLQNKALPFKNAAKKTSSGTKFHIERTP